MKRVFRWSALLTIALCGAIVLSSVIGHFVEWPLRFTGRQIPPITMPYDGMFLPEAGSLEMISYNLSEVAGAVVEATVLYMHPNCTNCSRLALHMTLFSSTEQAAAAYARQLAPTHSTYKRLIFLSTQPAYDLILSDVSENALYYVSGRWLIQIRTSSTRDLLMFFDALPY